MLYSRSSEHRVRCHVCAHTCTIEPGARGICAVRENVDGTLYSLVYGRLVARDVDPIEKKPLFHFLPGTTAYSVATVGCNFRCLYCQNHVISQYPRDHGGDLIGDFAEPQDVVADALSHRCRSIAYTYSEPTVAIEYVLDMMREASARGLANVWVSNGYFTRQTADEIIPLLGAANIDLKGITERVYHDIIGARLRPVLDSIERLHDAGVWVEVTTLLIPGINDSDDELQRTAQAICRISPAIPWHISRFFPAYRLNDRPPTPVERLERAARIGREAGLRFVYLGNLRGEGESTRCPSCGTLLIERDGYIVRSKHLRDGVCPACGEPVEGIWDRDG